MDNALTLTRKIFDPVETHFTPGERSMVAWISCDNVDHERDVVVASGVDFKTYFLGKTPAEGNPVVLAVHDFGRWPLGKCAWIQLKKNGGFNGLYAKTVFDGDEEAEKVWGKIRAKSLRGISIGFRPPDDLQPGEWGPPTKDELARRPDWKGAERIIRRCVLLEYSVCSLPMNPRALVDAVNKGLHRPIYEHLSREARMDTDEPLEDEEKAEKPCDCDKADCEACQERLRTKDEEDGDGGEEEDAETKAVDAAETESSEAEEDLEDETEESAAGFKRGDHVKVKSPHYKGLGVVQGVHKRGIVPHADNDLMASKEEPAARVKAYKAMGDGHTPTDFHVAVKCMHMSKMDAPMVPPSKAKAAKGVEAKAAPEPLPPLIALSEADVQQEMIKQAAEAATKRVNELFGVV